MIANELFSLAAFLRQQLALDPNASLTPAGIANLSERLHRLGETALEFERAAAPWSAYVDRRALGGNVVALDDARTPGGVR